MKKAIIITVILFLCILIIPKTLGYLNTSESEPAPEKISVTSEYAAIEKFIGDSENPYDELSNYLVSWAKDHNFKVTKDKAKNVIIEKPAKEGYESAPSTILHGNSKDIASALYVLETSKTCCDLKVLYTHPGDGINLGASSLDPSVLKSDYLISIEKSPGNFIVNSASGMEKALVSKNLNWVSPTNTFAYEISLQKFHGGNSGLEAGNGYGNPIKIAGNFLAVAKSQGVILELAGFNSGTDANLIPNDATFSVVVNEYDSTRITALFNKTANSFEKNYGSVEKDAVLTMSAIDVPDKVLSKESAGSVISYLYGFVNGVYSKSDDDKIIASSNIGTAFTYTGQFTSNISTTCSNAEKALELNNDHRKLCYLTGMDYKFESESPIWNSRPGSTLLPNMVEFYNKNSGKSIDQTTLQRSLDCAFLAQKSPLTDMICMSVESPEKLILRFLGD